MKRYPPSERKLARLWQSGSTPARPALVAGAVILVAVVLGWLGGPLIARWMAEWVRGGLHAAGRPETALTTARAVALRGGILAAGITTVLLIVAVVAQAAQSGSRPEGTPEAPAGREQPGIARLDAWQGARSVLLTALAAVIVAAALRAVLAGTENAFDVRHPMAVFGALLRPVGLPLLIVLLAVAVLDTIVQRSVWLREARMSHREVEEELRDTEGHPLTRERRGVISRRREDA